jgi:hypothetical protein
LAARLTTSPSSWSPTADTWSWTGDVALGQPAPSDGPDGPELARHFDPLARLARLEPPPGPPRAQAST